jgi:hypothetical protein
MVSRLALTPGDTMVVYEQFISYNGAENLLAILRRAEKPSSGTDALR